MSRIQSEKLKELVRSVLDTHHEHAVGEECETCFQKLDQFVEYELDGKDPAQAFPLIKSHLECCEDCTEEYEALLSALEKLEAE